MTRHYLLAISGKALSLGVPHARLSEALAWQEFSLETRREIAASDGGATYTSRANMRKHPTEVEWQCEFREEEINEFKENGEGKGKCCTLGDRVWVHGYAMYLSLTRVGAELFAVTALNSEASFLSVPNATPLIVSVWVEKDGAWENVLDQNEIMVEPRGKKGSGAHSAVALRAWESGESGAWKAKDGCILDEER